MKFSLSTFDNTWYKPGSSGKIIFWMLISQCFFETFFPWPSSLKRKLLTWFGAEISKGVVIKPHVQIKYPWFLTVGEFSWLGEHVWIDNLGRVTIGSDSVLSQGVYLCTGNHNFKSKSFDLMVGEISIGDSVWIGANGVVAPGVTINDEIVVSLGSVVKSDLLEPGIYAGNPAIKIK
ncbi:MAG: WcaF family extracellular polysaccharide biosynthesis acetyltransferase [Bacteroidetes bacterium]|nr:WcaF family extracellular polysaccharide biosynthesis acetyltransferase [Bacteroidota bacterium]